MPPPFRVLAGGAVDASERASLEAELLTGATDHPEAAAMVVEIDGWLRTRARPR